MKWINVDGKIFINLAHIMGISIFRPHIIRLYQKDDKYNPMVFFVEEDDIDAMLDMLGRDDSGMTCMRTFKSKDADGEEV